VLAEGRSEVPDMAPKRGRRACDAETSSAAHSCSGGARRGDAAHHAARGRLPLLALRSGKRPRLDSGAVLFQPSSRAPATPLDPRLGDRDPPELLRRFLTPVETKVFLRSCWARKAVAIHGPPGRMRPLIRDFMHDLSIPALLEETPSERVHAWVRRPQVVATDDGSPAPLESVTVDAEAALGLARAGAALYFRAPEELENLLVPGLCRALGLAFAGRYPGDGRPRGEIETFIAGRGHVTGWHTDFQHNFSIQLRGSKVWRFKCGPVLHNLRALTPHYTSRAAYEQQMKLHLLSDPSSPEFRPPEAFFEDAEEVTLSAGAVLYHPAGIWHRVECNSEDSVSINVSLSAATWAELVGDGLRQLLWASPALRAPIVGVAGGVARTRAAAEAMLADVRRRAAMLTAEDLLPPAMLEEPRLPSRVNVATSRLGSALLLRPGDRFKFSQLAVMVELPLGRSQAEDGTQLASSQSEASDDGEAADYGSSGDAGQSTRHGRGAVGAGPRRIYALHVNFGNEEMASWLRVRVTIPWPLVSAMTWLQSRHLACRRSKEDAAVTLSGVRASDGLGAFTARELLAAAKGQQSIVGGHMPAGSGGARAAGQWARVARLLRVLCHCGYLHKLPSKTRGARTSSQPRLRGQFLRHGGSSAAASTRRLRRSGAAVSSGTRRRARTAEHAHSRRGGSS